MSSGRAANGPPNVATTSPASASSAPRIARTRAVRASIEVARDAATPVTSPSPRTTGRLESSSSASDFAGFTKASEEGR